MPEPVIWGAGGALLLATVAVLALRRWLAVVEVDGVSMLPTLRPGQRLVVRRLATRRVRVGDIVVYRVAELATPLSAAQRRYREVMKIKRVAAVGGQPVPGGGGPAGAAGGIVPSRSLFVLGDNPTRSIDSRQAGPVAIDDVYGIVWRRDRAGRS